MENETRRIIYIEDPINYKHCQLLKSNGNSGWNKNGRRKNVKGVYDLLLRKGINNLEIDDEVWEKLEGHMIEKYDRKEEYNQILSQTKTI